VCVEPGWPGAGGACGSGASGGGPGDEEDAQAGSRPCARAGARGPPTALAAAQLLAPRSPGRPQSISRGRLSKRPLYRGGHRSCGPAATVPTCLSDRVPEVIKPPTCIEHQL
jgi:hypothetical protein